MSRGQVTMFIVVGIVILLVLGLGFAAWQTINDEKPPDDQNKQEVNIELKPLQLSIEQCLEATGRDALERAGLHGGYINPQQRYLVNPIDPTTSRALEAFPGVIIPYWSYLASPNDCTSCAVATEQPPLEGEQYPAIQAQVVAAVEAALPACLNDFSDYADRYVITPKSEPHVTVSFDADATRVSLDYELVVQTQAQTVSTLRSFSTAVDIPFRALYEQANATKRAAEDSDFFEGLSLETITLAAAGADPAIPPPFGGTAVSYDPGPYWSLPAVTDTVAASLEEAVSLVQVVGSRDMAFVQSGDALTDVQYANYYFGLPTTDERTAVSFTYLRDWQPHVSVHPGGQLIRPEVQSLGLPFMPPIKRMDFQYDVSYPVLVQLQRETSKGDFTFAFAIESNLRLNNPLAADGTAAPQTSIELCSPQHKVGTLATVTVTDTAGTPLPARVHYTCVTDSCDQGVATGGSLETQLPVCIGGNLQASYDGFRTTSVAFDSLDGEAQTTIEMERLYTVNVTPTLRYVQKTVTLDGITPVTNWVLTQNTFALDERYEAIILFTPLGREDEAAAVRLPGDGLVALAAGEYAISAVLLETRPAPYVVPGKEICYDTEPLNPFGGEQCQDIPDVTLGSKTYSDPGGVRDDLVLEASVIYVGGLERAADDATVALDVGALQTGTLSVPLIAISLPELTDVEDLAVFDQIATLSSEVTIS